MTCVGRITITLFLLAALLACTKSEGEQEGAGSAYRVFAGDKSVPVRKDLVESTVADLTNLMRRNIEHFNWVFQTVKEGMDDCGKTAGKIREYLDDSLKDDKKLYMRMKRMEAQLTEEEMRQVTEQGRPMLQEKIQAFDEQLPANLELLRKFKRMCPGEAKVISKIMQRFMRQAFK